METKDLMYKRAYVWDKLNAEERKACMDMGEDYKAFLNESKTERRCAAEIIRRAKEAGFVCICERRSSRPATRYITITAARPLCYPL